MDNDPSSVAANSIDGVASMEKDLLCSCCCELMIHPTTLNCGHTTCRHCLANWVTASKKTICPQCRQPFVGIPRTNVTIRNTIEHFFPEKHAERRREIDADPNTKSILADFEDTLAKQLKRNEGNILTSGCCFGAFLVVSLGVCFWFGSSLLHSSSNDYLLQKPVPKWTAADVGQYVAEQGAWAEQYAPLFPRHRVTGTLLDSLTDDYLKTELEIADDVHRRALLQSFANLLKTGISRLPANLWEYRSLHPGRTLFLLYGFVHCPRTTMLYLYYFDFDDVLFPLLQGCCISHLANATEGTTVHNASDIIPMQSGRTNSELSTESAGVAFFARATLLPYLIFAEFVWDWIEVHYWLSWGTIITCLLLTVSEAASLRRHFSEYLTLHDTSLLRYISQIVQSSVKTSLIWVVVFLATSALWHVTPKFVADALFYAELLYVPAWQLRQLFRANFQL